MKAGRTLSSPPRGGGNHGRPSPVLRRRRIAVAIVLAVACLLGLVRVAGTAEAAAATRLTIGTGWQSCPAGYVCLWTLNNYSGQGYAFFNSELDYQTLPAPFNAIQDNSWSFYNNGNTSDIRFFRANQYGQDWFVLCKQMGIPELPPNSALPTPGNPPGAENEPGRGWRDVVSSHNFGAWC